MSQLEGTAHPTVSFDLDGVIMQNPFARGIEPHIREHMRRSPALAQLPIEEADRRTTVAIREAWGKRAAAGQFVACYDWDSIYQEVSERFAAGPAPDVAELVSRYCDVEGMIWPLPGARSGLEALIRKGFRIVAITNGYYAYQWPVLEALGVAGCFESVVTPEAAGYAKPDPRLFSSVTGLLAHVGDNLFHDTLGANLAGIGSVWLHSSLPARYAALPVLERTRAPGFDAYVESHRLQSLYLQYHPEATPETCRPGAVVVDVDEAASVLDSWFGG